MENLYFAATFEEHFVTHSYTVAFSLFLNNVFCGQKADKIDKNTIVIEDKTFFCVKQ